MSMVCPQCSQVFSQQERICPTCSVHLLFYAPIAPSATVAEPEEDYSSYWQHTPWGRIIIGVILAQGLALGLKHLLTAGMRVGGGANTLWDSSAGFTLLHSLHAFGLLIGGGLAGAGQERGTLVGAIVGLANGMIFMALQPLTDNRLPDFTQFGQPLLHVVFGAIGGWMGKSIWTPTPRLMLPESKSLAVPPPTFEMRWLHGPIAWTRVIAASTIMACGVIWSNMILNWMIDASQGALNVTTHFQARLISWEIAGLTMIAGAILAGSTSWNGTKQGLCAGVGAAVLYAGFQIENPTFQLETAVFVVSCMLGLGLAGGWFGGHLFPPVSPGRRLQRIVDG